MAILDRLKVLCCIALDPEYHSSQKAVIQAEKLLKIANEWEQTGHKPRSVLHELLVLRNLLYEQAIQDSRCLKWQF